MNQRMCVSCRKRTEKDKLIRLEKVNDKPVISQKKTDGTRGVYLCYDLSCLKKAVKSNAIGRHLKCDVSSDLYEQIKNCIERNINAK